MVISTLHSLRLLILIFVVIASELSTDNTFDVCHCGESVIDSSVGTRDNAHNAGQLGSEGGRG